MDELDNETRKGRLSLETPMTEVITPVATDLDLSDDSLMETPHRIASQRYALTKGFSRRPRLRQFRKLPSLKIK